ncbi:MAG: D-sedoheptulose 7-phosphate isomerase [Acidobacteriota bacterium]|nr:D-sedoheptulose 7-phosphate isomerase [Acidobacteriota bacterium]
MERVLAESAGTVSSLDGILPELGEAIELVSERLRAGGCLIVFGNGGSAAQAQHLAAELVGRFEQERRSIPALALTTDPSIVTAVGNDYGFEEIFARQVRALARAGDVALAISTSGNSPNVLRALDAAREKNLSAIGLTGRNGGRMRDKVDICLCVPSDSTPRIQEAHLVISHILCSRIETSVISGLSRE